MSNQGDEIKSDIPPWALQFLDGINLALLFYKDDSKAGWAMIRRDLESEHLSLYQGLGFVAAELMRRLDYQASHKDARRLSGVETLNKFRDRLLSKSFGRDDE